MKKKLQQKKSGRLQTQFSSRYFNYDGSQLRHLFAYEQFQIQGDSLVAWQGPCAIPLDKMIDGEDRFSKSSICGDMMLHFIGEFFQPNIHFSVALQRLFAGTVHQELAKLSPKHAQSLIREGDDIFVRRKKMSISIASVSAFSAMIHFAINIQNSGTPVPTAALEDLKISPRALVQNVFSSFSKEYNSLVEATEKVFFIL